MTNEAVAWGPQLETLPLGTFWEGIFRSILYPPGVFTQQPHGGGGWDLSPLFPCTPRPVPRIPFAGGRDEGLGSLQPQKMWFFPYSFSYRGLMPAATA